MQVIDGTVDHATNTCMHERQRSFIFLVWQTLASPALHKLHNF